MTGYELIASERQRQIDVENWSEVHDDQHGSKVLELAAYCYRDAANTDSDLQDCWPWSPMLWKPKDRKRNLERAVALYQAAADAAERAGSYDEKRRLLGQVNSCAILLDSIIQHDGSQK
ncbi:hypothetical protein [Vibrio sp. 10N.239.312.D08]|uniref:hypothetical protein n=1 Tax=Vibrio sp. 10N.239.312.D08 TaxID=3229978 RepID=UPI0035501FD9